MTSPRCASAFLRIFHSLLTTSLFASLLFANAAYGTDVKTFGAKGDGIADDTASIQRAIDQTPDGQVTFPRGDYRITQPLIVQLDQTDRFSLDGLGGVGRIVMDGPGPAIRMIGNHEGTASPDSFKELTWQKERLPQISSLEIFGKHPEADGIELSGVMQPTLHAILIRETRHGIILRNRNRNLLIDACHIYNCSGVGVLFDNVNLHQSIILGSHISYCKQGGIKIVDGEIRNFQITGNDIEYNYDVEAEQSADILFDLTNGTVAEGTITGNTIQAKVSPGGANIRFIGPIDSPHPTPMSMWTIAGNIIGSQEVNIHLTRCRGMTVSANHIYSAQERTLKLEQCQNIVIGENSLDQSHNTGKGMDNGVTIKDSSHIILSSLILDDCAAGSETSGGAIEVFNSRNISIANCQITNPTYRGIWLEGSSSLQVVNNQITKANKDQQNLANGDDSGQGESIAKANDQFAASIEISKLTGPCIIKDNLISRGEKGAVLTAGSGDPEDSVIVKDNLELK